MDGHGYQQIGHRRYITTELQRFETSIRPSGVLQLPNASIHLDIAGRLTIGDGYVWNGPNPPAIHDSVSVPASLPHDAGYDLIRAGLLPAIARGDVDALFYRICLELGMLPFRAAYYYAAVRACGAEYASGAPQAAARRGHQV